MDGGPRFLQKALWVGALNHLGAKAQREAGEGSKVCVEATSPSTYWLRKYPEIPVWRS